MVLGILKIYKFDNKLKENLFVNYKEDAISIIHHVLFHKKIPNIMF